MRWTLIFAVLIVAVFVVTLRTTADIWKATNGAGIVALIFIIGAAVRITRLFDIRWQRITAATISALLIAGLTTHWIITWRTSEWQYEQLQSIRRIVFDGTAMAMLKRPALETFREFRGGEQGRSIGGVFRQLYPPGVPFADSLIANWGSTGGPFSESVNDSSVQLTEEALSIPGFDSTFVNRDGKHGLAQISIRITREGAMYDIQN